MEMSCSGPPNKRECKTGRKKPTGGKTFKTGGYGRKSKSNKKPPTIPRKDGGSGTHGDPNRMVAAQTGIPNSPSKGEMKAKKRYLKEKKKAGESTSTLMQSSYSK